VDTPPVSERQGTVGSKCLPSWKYCMVADKEVRMSTFETYLVVFAGILISFALPLVKPAVNKMRGRAVDWDVIWPYVKMGIFSAIAALLLVAFLGNVLDDWQAALMAGYAWDSTFQKIGT